MTYMQMPLTTNGKEPLIRISDEDHRSLEHEAIGMILPYGFRLQESGLPALNVVC